MTRFVRNPDGAIHSVPDEFEYPTDASGKPIDGWGEADEKDASPQLLGQEPDPVVAAVELHDLADAVVEEIPSNGHVGDDEPVEPAVEAEVTQ